MNHARMLRAAAAAVVLCFLADPAVAQFHMRTTVPADGETDVPLQTVIRFDFSEAVSTSNDFVRSIVVEPRDKVTISTVALLVRDLSQPASSTNPPAVVEFTVEHEPNTDYTWLVYAVENADGEFMDTPYTLRYTTASNIGAHTVSGTVLEVAPAKMGAPSAAARAHLRTIFERLLERGYGMLANGERIRANTALMAPTGRMGVVENAHAQANTDAAAALEPHTQILFLSEFDVRPEQQEILAAGVIRGTSGPYEIEQVRPGTYWPIAVRYTDELHQTIEALGFYDAEGDQTPSSVTVGGDVEGVDIMMYPFAPSTAREQLGAAQAAVDALGYDPAPVLQLIDSRFGGRTDGTAYGWSYRFYSGYADTLITVHADPLGVDVIQEPATSTSQRIVEPLTGDFIDSDEALQLALERGGADVIARYPPENIVVSMFGGNRHWLFPEYEPTQFWDVYILASSTTGVESFDIRLDMETGETIVVGVDDEMPVANGFRVESIYPNPVSTTATIPIVTSRTDAVSLTVYDMLGRRVATLVDGVLPAGRHEVKWALPRLPAGTYALVMIVGGASESRTVVVAP